MDAGQRTEDAGLSPERPSPFCQHGRDAKAPLRGGTQGRFGVGLESLQVAAQSRRGRQWVADVRFNLSMSAVETPVLVGCIWFQACAW